MSIGKPFEAGRAKTGGRARGTRNKISESFLRDLLVEWEQSGPAALKIMAKEDPSNFVRVTAALLPREFEITENHLMQIPDDELDSVIEHIRRQIAERAIELRSRENQAIN